jgi:hypothetical protein
MVRVRRAAALVLVLPLLAACGGGDKGTPGPVVTPCQTLPPAKAGAAVPAHFPALPSQVIFDAYNLGPTTKIVLAYLPSGDFLKVRDDLVGRLRGGGYQITSTDQESVEAEAAFTGPVHGTIKVTPLCVGTVEVRYRFLG